MSSDHRELTSNKARVQLGTAQQDTISDQVYWITEILFREYEVQPSQISVSFNHLYTWIIFILALLGYMHSTYPEYPTCTAL